MRRMIGLLALVALLTGCTFTGINPAPVQDETVTPGITLLIAAAKIYRPLISKGDDWNVTPMDRYILDFATRRDQYGNPIGLSDDKIWMLEDVHIVCSLKDPTEDTVFTFPDAGDFSGNQCVWYPTWTGPIESYSGLPYTPFAESSNDYPFDPCWSDKWSIPHMGSQTATITARAHADHLWIKIVAPLYIGGSYILDIPGATPQDSNEFEIGVGNPGDITVVWQDGSGGTETYTVTVPSEWFWVSGSWEIPVGSNTNCKGTEQP